MIENKLNTVTVDAGFSPLAWYDFQSYCCATATKTSNSVTVTSFLTQNDKDIPSVELNEYSDVGVPLKCLVLP